MSAVVWINGTVYPPADATISVFDRGFLYGDSVYETLRVERGVAFAEEAHLERLRFSAERIGWVLPFAVDHLGAALASALRASAMPTASARIIATRGSGTLGLDPQLAADPQLIVMILELPHLPASWYEAGRAVWLVTPLGRAVDPLAKTGNYMHSVLALSEAKAHGADDAIMLDSGGQVTESTVANVFAKIGGRWCTPPLAAGILSGITRRTLLDLGNAAGVPISERPLSGQELRTATEVFLSSSVRELVPVTRLDGATVGDGKVGADTRRLRQAYRTVVEAYIDAALSRRPGPA